MNWMLIVYIYAGAFASSDSVSLQDIHGFSTKETCVAAGELLKPLVNGTAKELRYVCVKQQ